MSFAAALACACGRHEQTADTSQPPGETAAPAPVGTAGTSGTTESVVVTGCLQRASGNEFVLVNAKPGEPDAAFVLEDGDLAEHEHQLVRVTGHFPDPLAGGVLSGRTAPEPNDVAHMRHVQVDGVEMVAAKCAAK
jgi:hypothetical protein